MKKVISFAEALNKIKMKKPLFVFALFVCSLLQAHQAAAQYKYFVTGYYYRNTQNIEFAGYKSTLNVLRPTIGYQLNENWAVGAGIAFTRNVTKNTDFPTQNRQSTVLGLSPFVRYQTPIIGKLTAYSDASLSASSLLKSGSKPDFVLALGAGLLYPISPRLFLTTYLAGADFRPKGMGFNLYSQSFTALSASLSIGFNYRFNFKKEKN